jgi:CBS domain-containing protein
LNIFVVEMTDDLLASAILSTRVAAVPATITIGAARKVAALKGADDLLVEEGGRLIGILCGTDLTAAPDQDLVAAWSRRPVTWVHPMTPVMRARELMLKTGLSCLPVLAGTWLVGVVTRDAIERAVGRPAHHLRAAA